MAGMGKRMRPHTLVTPKPLIEFAGKPMVHHIVEELARTCHEPIEEIAFVIGDFGKEAEKSLIAVAEKVGAKGSIYHQVEALGTAHAVLCAAESMQGKLIVAFADTLFKADFILDESKDAVIWVQQVEDPKELQYLIDNDLKEKGEYQITNALENMKQKGLKFAPGKVIEWLDCGNKNNTVYTHARWLESKSGEDLIDASLINRNALIIEPCFIGKGVTIVNSVVGPHVSLADGCSIENTIIRNSIVQKNTRIQNSVIGNSMIGSFVEIKNQMLDLSVGDYSVSSTGI